MLLSVIIGMFSAISLCFSVFALIHVTKYENLRIRSKDNEDELSTFKTRIKSLENKFYAAQRSRKSNQFDDLATQLLARQLGLEHSENDDVDDDELDPE